ncbi:MAG: hypothetical protein RIR70_1099 [Pseudomonadota bacterium]|jgi:hypothetical protein
MANTRLPHLAAEYGQLAGVELYSLNEQVDQAQAMLAQSLGILRECFEAISGMPSPDPRHIEHLDRAMIALQSEDMVGQLLDHTRLRLSRLARLSQLQHQLITLLAAALTQHCQDTALLKELEKGIEDTIKGLIDLAEWRVPVKDDASEGGPVQLF